VLEFLKGRDPKVIAQILKQEMAKKKKGPHRWKKRHPNLKLLFQMRSRRTSKSSSERNKTSLRSPKGIKKANQRSPERRKSSSRASRMPRRKSARSSRNVLNKPRLRTRSLERSRNDLPNKRGEERKEELLKGAKKNALPEKAVRREHDLLVVLWLLLVAPSRTSNPNWAVCWI
jgi:hypothetical protein